MIIRTEAGILMQAIREICSSIGRYVACAVAGLGEIHLSECIDDVPAGELAAQLLLQYAKDK